MVNKIKRWLPIWNRNSVSLGFPSPCAWQIVERAETFGKGWVSFYVKKERWQPWRISNDASMQASAATTGA